MGIEKFGSRVTHQADQRARLSSGEQLIRDHLLGIALTRVDELTADVLAQSRRGTSTLAVARSRLTQAQNRLQLIADASGLVASVARTGSSPEEYSWRIQGRLAAVAYDADGVPAVSIGEGDAVDLAKIYSVDDRKHDYRGVRGGEDLTPDDAERLMELNIGALHNVGSPRSVGIEEIAIPEVLTN